MNWQPRIGWISRDVVGPPPRGPRSTLDHHFMVTRDPVPGIPEDVPAVVIPCRSVEEAEAIVRSFQASRKEV